VRLLADLRREEGPNMILRENVQRRIVASANVSARDLGSVIDDIRRTIAQTVPMPGATMWNMAVSSKASRAHRDGC
jgi:Cu/Ag efflux pump CusA